MPTCPTCRAEYRKGFDWCPDCRIALVEALPGDDSSSSGSAARPEDEVFVTVGTFPSPTAASILASRLEAEGIEAFLDDAETVSMDPLWATAIGGVKVRVKGTDAARAMEIARRPPEKPPEDPDDPGIPCPKCKSTSTIRETFSSRLAFLSILLLGFPWPFRKEGRRKCISCGHAWKEVPPGPATSG